ncbi:hypothetical protein CDAR_536061 [Caerostris darwini]|uniref:Uncharacterized protein n=1 Tax=Caerostris darwini TaxID=1538125 RepID=A0AAV4QPT7_9ARAC|nr:hypothetical protein CDAR_536061 [Caerostris darwini]
MVFGWATFGKVPSLSTKADGYLWNSSCALEPIFTLYPHNKWLHIYTDGRISMHLEIAEPVARFRPTTGHYYLQVHIHRIDSSSDGFCPLCRITNMGGDHLRNCTEFIDVAGDITAGDQEARCRMAE